MHVLETVESSDDGRPSVERVSVTVNFAPYEPSDRAADEALVDQANAAFKHSDGSARVVRRYRQAPDALVRDLVRRYRTGRLESVLAGDFDLCPPGR